jgi:protein-arginine kinase activator protein McsA
MLIISSLKGFICPSCDKFKENMRKDCKICNECFGKVEEEMIDFIKNNDNQYGFKNGKEIKQKFKYF